MGNYLVISSDCHAGPPAELYRSYMDPSTGTATMSSWPRWPKCVRS